MPAPPLWHNFWCASGVRPGPNPFSLFTLQLSRPSRSNAHGVLQQQYADDTQLYISISAKTITPNTRNDASRPASQTYMRFSHNWLALNPSKSEALLLGTSQRLKTLATLGSVNISGTTVSLTTQIKLRSAGPTIWNSLPLSVTSCSTINTFEKQLETHLFASAFPSSWIVLDAPLIRWSPFIYLFGCPWFCACINVCYYYLLLLWYQGSNCEKWLGRVTNTAGTKGLRLGGHNGMNRGTRGLNRNPSSIQTLYGIIPKTWKLTC